MKNNIFAYGIVNAAKNLPQLKDEKSLNRDEFDWKQCDAGITMFRWKDKGAVNLLSNFHDRNDVESDQRKQEDGSASQVPCPKILILNCNVNMNFVDNFCRTRSTAGAKMVFKIVFSLCRCDALKCVHLAQANVS